MRFRWSRPLERSGSGAVGALALENAPVRTGLAPSGDRTSVLPRAPLTGDRAPALGGGGRAGPGPDPSVAVAAATFPRCLRIFEITIRQIVCHRLAPQAYDPSHIDRGTAFSASSVDTMTTGTVSSASVSDAQRIPPVPKVGDGSRSA